MQVTGLLLLLSSIRADPAPSEVSLESAFPDFPRFDRPLFFGPIPDRSGRHVVVERPGRVHVFEMSREGRATSPRHFLDLTRWTRTEHNEEGLLGIAFHPRFAENGRFFVHYSRSGPRRGRIAEFLVDPSRPDQADPRSERVVLEVRQPWGNHNGGHLEFGPDGMLYITLGDGGAAGDPRENAQDLSTLLGSILRIDVDGRTGDLPYAIPPDNPFVGRPGARGEIWALGLRNVWRFSFDPKTGRLWGGDVGQDLWEEIDAIEKGGNYGWPWKEGFADFRPRGKRGPGEFRAPVLAYDRDDGWSVTGGYVYRGEGVPALRGRYVYGDYVSGRIWAIDADPMRPPDPRVVAQCPSPSSFGIDVWGELYVCSFDGRIYRFVDAPDGSRR
jgi:glucose/arabinose dehydrogenase